MSDLDLYRRHVQPDGRLITLPVKNVRKALVLQLLAGTLPADVEMPETEINALLRATDDDVANLRRHLVEFRFVDRPAPGRYRRPSPRLVVLDDGVPDPATDLPLQRRTLDRESLRLLDADDLARNEIIVVTPHLTVAEDARLMGIPAIQHDDPATTTQLLGMLTGPRTATDH